MKMVLISLLLPLLALAQDFPFQQEFDSIPVQIGSWQPFVPWNQGLSYSYPAFGDLDGDGDLDLLVGVFQHQLFCYLNAGTPQQADFQWMQPQLDFGPYDASVEPTLTDLNGDGKPDLLLPTWTGVVRYYVNQSTPGNISFQLAEDSLTGSTQAWWLATADVDGDGLKELFSGSYFGTLKYFDNTGTAQNPTFTLVTNNFAGIDVGYDSSPTFCDIDGDGDYDLFIGNQNGHIWFYRNDGTPQTYSFTPVSNYWLNIDVDQMAAPTFCDIDGDGDYDLFIGRDGYSGTPAQTVGDVFFYRNNGTAQAYSFQYVTSNYLTADAGYTALPQLVDIDGDGTLDLLVACGNYVLNYHNTGTLANPSFNLAVEPFAGLELQDIQSWFCDIDGDGDMDLVAGTSAIPGPPSLYLYLNRSTPQNPNYVLYSDTFVTGNFFVLIEPTLVDINADGKLELFLTDQANHGIFYYENTGTPSWPNFQLDTTCWQGITWSAAMQRHLRFFDVDGDGDLDLFMINNWNEPGGNNLRFYRNEGTAQTPSMVLVTNTYLPQEVINGCANGGDIDGDGHPDMFIGDGSGGILYFHGTGDSPVDPNPKRPEGPPERMITILPNPGNSGTIISYVLDHPQKISLDVYNLLGAKVATLASGLQLPGNYSYTWDASAKASGIYILRFTTPDQSISRKITILK